MKLKKVLLGATAVALTAAVAIGATYAYMSDTDEDVNVMTLGNVHIEQIEQERVDGSYTELTDFEQNKHLLPAVYDGDSIDWADENNWVVAGDEAYKVVEDNSNVVDKFVTVKNTGESDAYVRTLIAFEEDSSMIHYVANGVNVTNGATWQWQWLDGTFEYNSANYSLAVVTYTDILHAGQTTIPSLKQIYLDKEATNEYCSQFGESYDIMVYSQAVQSKGFDSIITGPNAALDEAFGEVSLTSNPWVN